MASSNHLKTLFLSISGINRAQLKTINWIFFSYVNKALNYFWNIIL